MPRGKHTHHRKTEDIPALLKSAGLKATSARSAILSVFIDCTQPLSIQDLAERLGNDAHQATLYRAVERLVAAGVLLQVNLGTDSAHYELRDETHHHHHAICTDCGRIEDVQLCENVALEKEVLQSLRHFKTLRTHSLEFFGQCVTCINK